MNILHDKLERFFILICSAPFCFIISPGTVQAEQERTICIADVNAGYSSFSSIIDEPGTFTWWFPVGADEFILPISAGIVVNTSNKEMMLWLAKNSPWSCTELPLLGVRYNDQIIIAIIPWPHYAVLVINKQLGIRFEFPTGRSQVTPNEIVLTRRDNDPMEVSRAFREWRSTATTTGAIPRPRLLSRKITDLEKAGRLSGAPHIYLWGSVLFSHHDIIKTRAIEFAQKLDNAPPGSFGSRMVKHFTNEQRTALRELADAKYSADYLIAAVADAINATLSDTTLVISSAQNSLLHVIQANRNAFVDEFEEFLNPPTTWGDGLSAPLLNALRKAGIDRAVLLLSDLYSRSPRPDLVALADTLGYLVGPYDSYHCVHSPAAGPENTWETAQFDRVAFEKGRIINADGSGHTGFRGEGFHFSPQAAWPYVQKRVNDLITNTPYSTWFIDCDATAECFDDFSPNHPATRLDDTRLRRQRLNWLESQHNMVVGSEGGSVLFADVIHFGHGVHTHYIGHLDPSFSDIQSPHYLGKYWPPYEPQLFFKSVPIPLSLKTPYFDPTGRIPLYQAALGDQVIATHHWCFDSFKFSDIQQIRELMEILYMVPPMYHLNRSTWPERKERILRHLAFWGPVHKKLATAQLTKFEILSQDRLVQRTTFLTPEGEVTITVNFGDKTRQNIPPFSVLVNGAIQLSEKNYRSE